MINRTNASVTTGARVWETAAYTTGHVYQLAGATATPQDKGTVAVSGNAFNMTPAGLQRDDGGAGIVAIAG